MSILLYQVDAFSAAPFASSPAGVHVRVTGERVRLSGQAATVFRAELLA